MPDRREELEKAGRREIEKLQLDRLRSSLGRAARSPFYRELFASNSFRPGDLVSLSDLGRLPFTVKQDLRDSYPDRMLACPPREVVRMHSSSGTTGTATVVYHTAGDIDRWTGLVVRCLVMAGATADDVFQNMMGYGFFTGGLGLHYGAERLGMMVIPAGGGNTHRQIELFRDFGTTVIHVTPSYALHVSDVFREMGLGPEDFKIKKIIFGAEPYSEGTRSKLEEAYRAQAFNCYGLSEMNGPGVAFECRRSEGMHVWEDSYIVEIIDPASGEALPAGETGEVVFTTLTREAMPLIRYRTRDLAKIYPETACPCGRNFTRISRITGRSDDMLIVKGINLFPSQIEHVLMKTPGVGTNYLIVLDRFENLDRLTVRVEIAPGAFHGDAEEMRRLQALIKHSLREEIMVQAEVELLEPGALPPSQGKAKRVLDKRDV